MIFFNFKKRQPTLNYYQREASLAPTLILLHGIGSSIEIWDDLINELPHYFQVVAVDLLGFGKSPKSKNNAYNLESQVEALFDTLRHLKIKGPIVLCGHSLGGLVAIEFAKQHPKNIQQLILCSPPIYRPATGKQSLTAPDERLRMAYQQIIANSDTSYKVLRFVSKLPLFDDLKLNITQHNFKTYLASLQQSIIKQDTYQTILDLDLPINLIYGLADPLIVPNTLRQLTKQNSNIKIQSVKASHGFHQAYLEQVLALLNSGA